MRGIARCSYIWAMDFDGVVCDSAKELCMSAWAAARRLWPEQCGSWPERPTDAALAGFYEVRPVVETGWEAVMINRALREGRYDGPTILRDYTAGLRAQLLREYGGLEEKEYATVFHDTRMEWMRSDESGWLAESGFYPRVVDGLKLILEKGKEGKDAAPLYVLTTKGKDFALQLLRQAGLEEIPEDHVYGYGSGKKVDIMRTLLQTHRERTGEQARVVFAEDRLATLHGVMAVPEVHDHADLLLAGWGYNTAEERAKAAQEPSIKLLPTQDDFYAYVKGRLDEQN